VEDFVTQEGISQSNPKDAITRRGYCFVILWVAGILFFYGIVGYVGVRTLQGYKAETEKYRQAQVSAATTGEKAGTSGITVSRGAKPVDVLVGIYVNSIGEVSLKDSTWSADFDVWFRWTGDGVSPGKNFEIVNGQIDQRNRNETYTAGRERYERYRLKARLAKSFDSSRFPFNDQGLTVEMEDNTNGAERLHYVADEQGSGINRLGIRQGLGLTKSFMAVKLHSYESRRGDPRLSPDTKDVHSRFIFAMLVSPPSTAVYMKMFQALFASIAIAFIVFFIKPIHVDPRFGLGVGAAFAVIANNIFVGSLLPPSGGVTLSAMVNAVGLATIFLTLVQSAISLHILDTMGQEKLRLFFDRVSFAVFVAGYGVVNLLLPLAARS
jgi:hypothetical protein